MQQLTWDEILENGTLIGGDIESQEGGVIYRGPISEIKEEGACINFTCPWIAQLDPSVGTWKKWHLNTFYVSKSMCTPQVIGNGRIFFQLPLTGGCTIYPNGGSKLDASKVEGLPKNSERFLALFPSLRLDRKIVERILLEKTFSRACEVFSALPTDTTWPDLLSCFKHDSSAEEFLWHYVEAVTGEKDVYKKVY